MALNTDYSLKEVVKDWVLRLDRVVSGRFLFKGSQLLAIVAGICVVLLGIINLVTVIGRRSPWAGPWLQGGIDASELLMAIVSVSAVAYCWYIGAHIRISLLRDRAGSKIKAILDAASSFLFLVWIVGMTWSMWELFIKSLEVGERTLGIQIPVAPIKIFFTIVMAHFALVLFRSLLGFLAKASGRSVEHEGLY